MLRLSLSEEVRLKRQLLARTDSDMEQNMYPTVSTGKRRVPADAPLGTASPSKRARGMAEGYGGLETSPVFDSAEGRRAEPMQECSPSIRQAGHAVTNSVTTDEPSPELLTATAETCFSTESEQDGCVEGVGERNPSQVEELKWLKWRLRKLMAQQAKLVQRRTALRKVCRCL